MEKLFKSIEDSFQMDATSKESELRRRLCCANTEYFLRVNNVSDMSGDRSEIWARGYNRREYLRKLKESRKGE